MKEFPSGYSPAGKHGEFHERRLRQATSLPAAKTGCYPNHLSGLKALPQGIVRFAVTQHGRPDGRLRGCKATGMSPPKRYTDDEMDTSCVSGVTVRHY